MTDIHDLHIGESRETVVTLVPDDEWPKLYRIHWPDGVVSPPGNLTRAKDAAQRWAAGSFGVHDRRRFWWSARRGENGREQPASGQTVDVMGNAPEDPFAGPCEPTQRESPKAA